MSIRLRARIERLERKRPGSPELHPRLILIRGVKPGDLDKPLSWIEAEGHRFEREPGESEREFRARVEGTVPLGRLWTGAVGALPPRACVPWERAKIRPHSPRIRPTQTRVVTGFLPLSPVMFRGTPPEDRLSSLASTIKKGLPESTA